MSYSSSLPAGYRIDIIDQITRAYRIVIDRSQLVLEMALLPFVIVLATELVAMLLPGSGVFRGILVALIHMIGLLVFGTVFIVRWHRYVLLGESVSGDLIPPGWSAFVIAGVKVAVLFFICWFGLFLLAMLPPHFITFPLSMFGGIALAFLSLRVSLIFPAAAIEQPVPLRTAWDWVEGNYWRLFACTIGCYLPFVIVEVIISWIAGMFPALAWIVFEALRLAVSFAGAAVIAALLSHVYMAITGGGRPYAAE